ncbi:GNAT family N-acetyltransferase [Kitasatospora sp. NPDC004240]
MGYRIERIPVGEWQRMRAIRLAMLQDTPLAFLETYETALAHGQEEWQARTVRVNGPGWVGLVAVAEDGEWVGIMLSKVTEPGTALLMGVWVHPDHRGRERGVTDGLLDGILDWARGEAGADRLLLGVHELNDRAQAYYRRRGFEFTGGSQPYALDPGSKELEMVIPLR